MEYGAKLYRRITSHKLSVEYDTKLYRLITEPPRKAVNALFSDFKIALPATRKKP